MRRKTKIKILLIAVAVVAAIAGIIFTVAITGKNKNRPDFEAYGVDRSGDLTRV